MGWPYQFVDLSPEDKLIRRQVLDRYALCAQLSALVPVVLFLLFRLGRWARAAGSAAVVAPSYQEVPSSPTLKAHRLSQSGTWHALARRARWWLGGPVVVAGMEKGRRDEWLFGAFWAAWLLGLSVHGTGVDYLHLTKRLGVVAASQLPLHYLLTLKSLNPFAYVFGSSHEQLNRWHRVLGRIIWALLMGHVAMYFNFFVQAGLLAWGLRRPAVILGIAAAASLNFMLGTSLPISRAYSYRLFFVTHVLLAITIPVLVFFHAHSARVFMLEVLAIFAVIVASRRLDTVAVQASLDMIPGTSLVCIKASGTPLPKIARRYRDHPASHIYMSQVPVSTGPRVVAPFLFNPFTVADVDATSGDITLVARRRGGPVTNALAAAVRTGLPSRRTIPLQLEGPYGAAAGEAVARLARGDFDRVLLVAGGVGATYTVPLYRAMTMASALGGPRGDRVRMMWAVREAGDIAWVAKGGDAHGDGDDNILNDRNVRIFVTGKEEQESGGEIEVGGFALATTLPGSQRGRRPDLRKEVDDIFSHGQEERVAVLVCGPGGMARELREHVGAWVVRRGRTVWWHSEVFGW